MPATPPAQAHALPPPGVALAPAPAPAPEPGRVADADRFRIDELPEHYSGLYHLTITFGFQETRDIPGAIAAIGRQCPQLKINPDEIRYFASVMTLTPGGDAPMNPWRKHLYIWLARNATPRGEAFHLPPNRTMLMGGTLQI